MLLHRAFLSLVLPVLALAAEQDWAQPQDHPAHALFKSDGAIPPVGSPEWKSKYPAAGINGPTTPEKSDNRWIDALNAAKKANKIPNVQLTRFDEAKKVFAYPDGVNPSAPEVCTLYSACKLTDGTIKNGPDGTMGLNFDDGPTPATSGLIQFLKQNNLVATHFVIGNAVLVNSQQFQEIVAYGGDIAVHTWSHPSAMTSLTDEQIVAELGWATQIIYDSTGGKLPKFWRPPGGDADLRVRAIAKEVFGMTTVFWNQDTFDWMIDNEKPNPQHTPDTIAKDFDGWSAGPKSPGLIILEHEKNDVTVKVFTDNFPKMKNNGWNINSAAPLIKDGDKSSGGGSNPPSGGSSNPPSGGSSNPPSGGASPPNTSAGASQAPASPTNSNVKPNPNSTSSPSSATNSVSGSTGKNSSPSTHVLPWSWRIAYAAPFLLFLL